MNATVQLFWMHPLCPAHNRLSMAFETALFVALVTCDFAAILLLPSFLQGPCQILSKKKKVQGIAYRYPKNEGTTRIKAVRTAFTLCFARL